jgi:hypothetical protein
MTQLNDILACLPATPPEIASCLELSIHTVNSRLCFLSECGLAERTDLSILSDRKGRGRKRSWIWTRQSYDDADDDDDEPSEVTTADVMRMQRHALLRYYAHVRQKCAALHRKQRHAFTHIGLTEI